MSGARLVCGERGKALGRESKRERERESKREREREN
jgi:hypothetical protein